MIKKIVFLIVFVPLHFLLTVMLLQRYWFSYNPNVYTGSWPLVSYFISFMFAVPIVVPFILTDLSEHWPRWAQVLPYVINGLFWGVIILVIYGRIRRLLGKKDRSKGFQCAQPNAAADPHRFASQSEAVRAAELERWVHP